MRFAVIIAAVSSLVAWAADIASAQHHHQKGGTARREQGPPATDARVFVRFPKVHVEHTLANMRDHLAAVQEINAAMADGKFDLAARIAESRLGMSSLRSHGAHEVGKFMPKGMQEIGTAMHRAASQFALEAQNAGVTGDMQPALKALGETLSACVGCHAGYRLR